MAIYEGEITAILGHNGAGKTTLFNILTGLIEPTSGTIKVFGYDVRSPSDIIKIRRMIGVCPQYDILFEQLTPREHLKFFATLRVSMYITPLYILYNRIIIHYITRFLEYFTILYTAIIIN